MKLRVRLDGRTQRVEFDENPTIATVKGTVATLFGHDAATFELSLNGREALDRDPETPLSHFGIVSGDLIRIIRTHEGAVQSSGSNNPISNPPSQAEDAGKVSSPDPVRMEVDEEDQRRSTQRGKLEETKTKNTNKQIMPEMLIRRRVSLNLFTSTPSCRKHSIIG